MKFKRKIMLFEEFETAQAIQTTSTKVDVNVPNKGSEIRTEIVKDVDNIINSLEILSTQIKEDLTVLNTKYITESDSVLDKAIDYIFRGPKAKKAQAKVNKLALKVADLDAAKDQLPRGEKSQLQDKIDKLKQNRDDLQKTVDSAVSNQSSLVQSMANSEKIKGKMEVLKTGMGEASNKNEVKQQMNKLQNRLKAEEEAIKNDEPSSEEKERAEEQIKKEKEAKANANAEPKETKEGEPKSAEDVATEALGDAKDEYTKITADQKDDKIEVPSAEEGGEPTTKPKWTDIKTFKGKDAEGADTDEEVIYAKEDSSESALVATGIKLNEGMTVAQKFAILMSK